jgi:hypothetical protein
MRNKVCARACESCAVCADEMSNHTECEGGVAGWVVDQESGARVALVRYQNYASAHAMTTRLSKSDGRVCSRVTRMKIPTREHVHYDQ